MNVSNQGKAIVTCVGMREGVGRVYKQSDIGKEVIKAIGEWKNTRYRWNNIRIVEVWWRSCK